MRANLPRWKRAKVCGRKNEKRREFHKVLISNPFYLSLEVGREKVMIFALVFPTETLHFFLDHSEGRYINCPHHSLNNKERKLLSARVLRLTLFRIVVDTSGGSYIHNNMLCSRGDILSFQEYYPVRSIIYREKAGEHTWQEIDTGYREVPHFDSRPVSISDPRSRDYVVRSFRSEAGR